VPTCISGASSNFFLIGSSVGSSRPCGECCKCITCAKAVELKINMSAGPVAQRHGGQSTQWCNDRSLVEQVSYFVYDAQKSIVMRTGERRRKQRQGVQIDITNWKQAASHIGSNVLDN